MQDLRPSFNTRDSWQKLIKRTSQWLKDLTPPNLLLVVSNNGRRTIPKLKESRAD